MLKMSRVLCLVVLWLLPEQVFSVELEGQRKVFVSEKANANYRMALSEIKKINASVSIEREVSLRGRLKSVTYEFDRSMTVDKAWALLSESLPEERRILFSCDGLACGSSNSWANDVFRIKQLYGLDLSQKYRAYSLDKENRQFLIVYFVQRGNKRVLAQIDSVSADANVARIAPDAASIHKVITQTGFYAVPVVGQQGQFSFDASEVEALRKALRAMPLSRFYLVGHAYGLGSEDENKRASTAYAQALNDRLSPQRGGAIGKSKSRFQIRAVGHLAPDNSIPQDRVVVLVSRE